jgi:hypothetical protein
MSPRHSTQIITRPAKAPEVFHTSLWCGVFHAKQIRSIFVMNNSYVTDFLLCTLICTSSRKFLLNRTMALYKLCVNCHIRVSVMYGFGTENIVLSITESFVNIFHSLDSFQRLTIRFFICHWHWCPLFVADTSLLFYTALHFFRPVFFIAGPEFQLD